MKYKRLDIKYTPLQVHYSKSVSGSVPLEQTYDADQDEYSPDYRLTPCALQPVISMIDRDGILKSGRVNSELTDIAWYRVVDGVEGNALVTIPKQHVITSSGNDAGKLLWYINAAPQKPILLRFKAKYLDTRTYEVRNITMTTPSTARMRPSTSRRSCYQAETATTTRSVIPTSRSSALLCA